MGLIALSALAARWPILVTPLVAFGVVRGIARFDRRLALTTASVLAAVYSPGLVGLMLECAHCRQVWAFVWPVLPGGTLVHLASGFLGISWRSDRLQWAAGGIATVLLVTGLVWVAGRGRWWRLATVAIALTASTVVTTITYHVIQM
jgi:hypothetical protein